MIIEGDSAMATLTVCKLQYGYLVSKVTHNWRLAKTLHRIQQHISDLGGVYFQAVQRKSKAVVDCLANEWKSIRDTLVSFAWWDIREGLLRHDCEAINQKDNEGCSINEPFIGLQSISTRLLQAL